MTESKDSTDNKVFISSNVCMFYFVPVAHTAFQNINVGSKSACEVNTTLRDKSLRLVGGAVPYIGRLEVFHNNEWGVMCFDRFFAAEGHVACRQLGYSVIYNYAYVT